MGPHLILSYRETYRNMLLNGRWREGEPGRWYQDFSPSAIQDYLDGLPIEVREILTDNAPLPLPARRERPRNVAKMFESLSKAERRLLLDQWSREVNTAINDEAP